MPSRKVMRSARQHGATTSPKGCPTRSEGQRKKFPATIRTTDGRTFVRWADGGHRPPTSDHAIGQFEGLWHGTRCVIDKGAKRRANERSMAKLMREARNGARTYAAIAKEMGQ